MVTVSVVVPTDKRTDLLMGRCLPSIIAQTFTDWEAIVVGEPGSQATVDAMASVTDPRISFHSVPRPPYPDDTLTAWAIGWYGAIGHGLSLARGEWTTILADDDELLPHCFATLLARAEQTGADLVYGFSERRVGTEVSIVGTDLPPRFDDHCFGSHLIRRSRDYRYDPTSPSRGRTADGEWWERVLAEVPYARVKEVVHIYHQAPERLHWGPAFYGKEGRPDNA